ncbi:MAG: hypothetical protein ABIJ23_00535 [Candidatus Magasanikbacteria bacterium]
MDVIKIKNPKGDQLPHQLIALYETFKNIEPRIAINFDFSEVNFFNPLLLLAICSYIEDTDSQYTNLNNNISSYLSAVSFPKGIDSISEFEKELQSFKRYTPISKLNREKGIDRERLESMFATLVHKIVGTIPGARNAIYYPITELVTNIFDHSKTDRGYIFGQYYPNKNCLDICIIDRGRGLANTYKEEKSLDVSDNEAIKEVMRGHSTKINKERGYGVRTSKRVVCDCLGGEFTIISGSSALLSTKKGENLVNLPGFNWPGVIVAYRIPKPAGTIDISKYLE